VSGRWRVQHHETRRGASRWRVHDQEDAGRPVAEFADEAAAVAHAERLAAGPFDWDEQENWQDDEDDEDEDDSRVRW
jgi:hypothetical protein